jgi:thiol-disulfide isomerase/thioredoxin
MSEAAKSNWKVWALVAVLLAVWAVYTVNSRMAGNIVLADKFDPNLPTVMELGASWCPACRSMKPVMKKLQDGYTGFNVKYVDVEKDTATATKYDVTYIPVIVFMDARGTTLHSQVGAMSKGHILEKWKELGVSTAEAR